MVCLVCTGPDRVVLAVVVVLVVLVALVALLVTACTARLGATRDVEEIDGHELDSRFFAAGVSMNY